jgi:hypothetical protein
MIIGILVVVWIAVLTPIVVRHFRERDADRSIVSFHRRMAKLGTDEPIVAPAHRLDVSDEAPRRDQTVENSVIPTRTPRLRLVPSDTTSRDLEQQASWEEWSRTMSDEPDSTPTPPRRDVATPSRVSAYAHVPSERSTNAAAPTMQFGPRSQRVRRRRVVLTLASSVALSTLLFFVVSSVIVDVWALASWVGLAGFLGLMYYAMSTGMMSTPAIRLAGPVFARAGALAPRPVAAFTGRHDDEFDDSYDEDYAQAL